MFTSTPPPVASGSTSTRSKLAGLIADLGPHRGPSRMLTYTALFWMASAAFHTVVFVLSDTPWSGAVSWRKPIVFSLSIGLMLWAFGWVLDRLPHRPRLATSLAVVFAASSTVEVGLIALQQWRGRASHFNTFESGDALIFGVMGVMVGVMSLMLVALFVWSLVERPANRVERIAIVAGMAMIMSGLGIGQWLITLGFTYADQFNQVPETVTNGEAGQPKFPHAVAFHGIQVLMVAAALLGRSTIGEATAALVMRLTALSYFGVLVFSAVQTFDGRAPLDLNLISGPLLALSLIGLVGLLALMVQWWRKSPVDAGPSQAVDIDRSKRPD